MKLLYLLPVTCTLLLPLPSLSAVLTLSPTHRSNALGNPIYSLSGFLDGVRRFRIDAVSGTNRSQHRDRHIGNNYAPLPDGDYTIGSIEPGVSPDVGKTFVRLVPRFKTGRTNLGMHWDVSFGRSNGRDGTAGCIGLKSRSDRDRVINWLRRYKPKKLRVRIA